MGQGVVDFTHIFAQVNELLGFGLLFLQSVLSPFASVHRCRTRGLCHFDRAFGVLRSGRQRCLNGK
jgi:hypothetical protein